MRISSVKIEDWGCRPQIVTREGEGDEEEDHIFYKYHKEKYLDTIYNIRNIMC